MCEVRMHVRKPYYEMQDVPPSYTSLHCAVPVGAVPALTSHVNVPVTWMREEDGRPGHHTSDQDAGDTCGTSWPERLAECRF